MNTFPFSPRELPTPFFLTHQAGRLATPATAKPQYPRLPGAATKGVIDVSLLVAVRGIARPSHSTKEVIVSVVPARVFPGRLQTGVHGFYLAGTRPTSIVVPMFPQSTSVQKEPAMATNNDPDESVLMDYGIARQRIVSVFSRDGVIDPQEQAALDAFDLPYRTHGVRYHTRRVFESVMRNGLTKRTNDAAKHVGIAIVIGNDNYPANVIPFPDSDHGPRVA